MSARSKAGIVYAIVAAMVIGSWIGNIAVYRSNQLPEAGFLRHYIEAADNGGHFELLYMENRSDPRRIIGAAIDGLPWIRFQPPTEYTRTRYQRIERLLAVIQPQEKEPGEKAQEPIVVREVRVYFDDGTSALKDIGEIRLYRQAALPAADRATETGGEQEAGSARAGGEANADGLALADPRPYTHNFGSSSSDGSGQQSIVVTRPFTVTKVESALLPILGDSFEWELTTADDAVIVPPYDLETGQSLLMQYRFHLKDDFAHAADVFQLILQLTYVEPDGQTWTDPMYTTYFPNLTDSQVRALVRSQRRERA